MSTAKNLTNDALKDIMTDAVVYRGVKPGSLDEFVVPGTYYISPTYGNISITGLEWGTLIVAAGADMIVQMYFPINADFFVTRYFWKTKWSQWLKHQGTPLQT